MGGGGEWTNPGDAADRVNARASWPNLPAAQQAAQLRARKFRFQIPAHATIDGVAVRCYWVDTDGSAEAIVRDVILHKDAGSESPTDLGDDSTLPTALAYGQFGGPAELWGFVTALTPGDVNGEEFGFHLVVEGDATVTTTPEVDSMEVKVYFTEATEGEQTLTVGDDASVVQAALNGLSNVDEIYNGDVAIVVTGAGTIGTSVIDAAPGDLLTGTLYLTADPLGISSYSVSLEFDTDLVNELHLLSASEFLPAGFSFNITSGASALSAAGVCGWLHAGVMS